MDEGRGIIRIWSGTVTGGELEAAAKAESQDEERTRRLKYGIVDLSDVTELAMTPEDIRGIVTQHTRTAALMRRGAFAIVAPKDVVFGFARMWQVMVERTGWETQVFRSRAEADAWIQLFRERERP
ncbi:MAG TPA: hypothetical protein VJX67_23150 [Blastocatellia bacterium]|nr:hypothetical protein [Blastocatellia bacterium]